MEKIREWLIRLIGFNTTMDTGDTGECAGYIRDTLREAGVRAEVFTGRAASGRPVHHVYAVVPGSLPGTVLLHAHLDTAPYDTGQSWHFPAEQPSVRKDCICGRGALDCKSQIAVWMKLMADTAAERAGGDSRTGHSLALLVTDREETGGEDGLGALIRERPEIVAGVRLVVGEGGGFPFPYKDRLLYTFQTGEREDEDLPEELSDAEEASRILQTGIEKGYYSKEILGYVRDSLRRALSGRRLDVRPLYAGMEEWLTKAPPSAVWRQYGEIFERALQDEVPEARLMPYITPGYSDNRWFRSLGLPVIGFFPLDKKNALSGIHGADEYISGRSLQLAYRVMTKALRELLGSI